LLGRSAAATDNGISGQGFRGVTPYEPTASPCHRPNSFGRCCGTDVGIPRVRGPAAAERGPRCAAVSEVTPLPYWGLYEANHRTMLNLGAIYVLPVEDHYQLMDGSITSAQLQWRDHPVRDLADPNRDKSVALVWRGDFVSARTLALVKGLTGSPGEQS